MNGSAQPVSSQIKSNLPRIYNKSSNVAQIFSSFADYLIGMKEVVSLMFYIVEEDSGKLVLAQHRNMHQDFPRNLLRIEKTKYLASNVVESGSVMELRNPNFSVVSHKLGINIDRGFIGIPIKDNKDDDKAKGAILLWTSFVNRFDENRYKFIISMANYLSKYIEWSSKIENDLNNEY